MGWWCFGERGRRRFAKVKWYEVRGWRLLGCGGSNRGIARGKDRSCERIGDGRGSSGVD